MADKHNLGKDTVKGRVATDPQQHDLPDGGRLVAFRLAENKRYFDKQENAWKDADPVYYDVGIKKDQLAQNVLASVEKGQLVNVEGNQQISAYTAKGGEAQLGRRIYADDVAPSLQLDTLQRGPSADRNQGPTTSTEPAAGVQEAQQQAPAPTPPQSETTPAGQRLQEEAASSWEQAQTYQQPIQPQQNHNGPGLS